MRSNPMMMDRSGLLTEQRLADSMNLDQMSSRQIVDLMNRQDQEAVLAVQRIADKIAQAVELIVDRFRKGGRLIYVGAGSSGRLGVLDASECPPTFRTDPQQVIGIIAGGPQAMFQAQEGAEDRFEDGSDIIHRLKVSSCDVVCGIATGGTTPFVHGALNEARSRHAGTIFVTCVEPFPGEPVYDLTLRALTGPEVLTGSTRLKAGTATKLILNQLTTASMVRLGKCYENLMVDLKASNQKLKDRAVRVIQMICGTDRETALHVLEQAHWHVKPAVVMWKHGCSLTEAHSLIERSQGSLRRALEIKPVQA